MNTRPGRVAGLIAAMAWLSLAEAAEGPGTVRSERVNLRGLPSLSGEVITQLKRGEVVTVLEEIEAKKPRPGEPTRWLKVKLPPGQTVWVFSEYLDPGANSVKPPRLNLRAGPGENYSVLGIVQRGDSIKEIRRDGEWTEIEAPPSAYAFVGAEFVDRDGATPSAPPAPTEPVTQTVQDPAPAPVVAAPPVPADPVPAAVVPAVATTTTSPPPVVPPPATPAPVAAAPVVTAPVATEAKPGPLPRRFVTRQGIVRRTYSIQAPTEHRLASVETGVTVNYLHSEELGVSLNNFRGRRIIVTGEEFVDQRWPDSPVLEVQTVRLAD